MWYTRMWYIMWYTRMWSIVVYTMMLYTMWYTMWYKMLCTNMVYINICQWYMPLWYISLYLWTDYPDLSFSLSGRAAVPCVEPTTTLPSPSQSSKLSLPSPSLAEWNWEDEHDWVDYNYVLPAHSDPLAGLLDVLPGLDADAIAAMIRDLPMPDAVEVPGLRVDEAIEVWCSMQYIMSYTMFSNIWYISWYIP